VLRPIEFFSEPAVATASLDAIRLGAIGFDAVKPPYGAGSFG
jgi:hypothetical protein